MLHFPNVKQVIPLPNQHIKIFYDNGEIRIFDVTPYIKGSWFGKLADLKTFETVHPLGDTVEWSDGQDIAPHELYEHSILVSDDLSEEDIADIEQARAEFARGEFVRHEDIDWD